MDKVICQIYCTNRDPPVSADKMIGQIYCKNRDPPVCADRVICQSYWNHRDPPIPVFFPVFFSTDFTPIFRLQFFRNSIFFLFLFPIFFSDFFPFFFFDFFCARVYLRALLNLGDLFLDPPCGSAGPM